MENDIFLQSSLFGQHHINLVPLGAFDWRLSDNLEVQNLHLSQNNKKTFKFLNGFLSAEGFYNASPEQLAHLLSLLQKTIKTFVHDHSKMQRKINKMARTIYILQKTQKEKPSINPKKTKFGKNAPTNCTCPICFKTFSSLQNLDRHIYHYHESLFKVCKTIREQSHQKYTPSIFAVDSSQINNPINKHTTNNKKKFTEEENLFSHEFKGLFGTHFNHPDQKTAFRRHHKKHHHIFDQTKMNFPANDAQTKKDSETPLKQKNDKQLTEKTAPKTPNYSISPGSELCHDDEDQPITDNPPGKQSDLPHKKEKNKDNDKRKKFSINALTSMAQTNSMELMDLSEKTQDTSSEVVHTQLPQNGKIHRTTSI